MTTTNDKKILQKEVDKLNKLLATLHQIIVSKCYADDALFSGSSTMCPQQSSFLSIGNHD
jgi:hypothetical protein